MYCLCHLACLLHKLAITTLFVAVHWLILLHCRIMNEVPTFCSKFKWEEGDIVEWEEGVIVE